MLVFSLQPAAGEHVGWEVVRSRASSDRTGTRGCIHPGVVNNSIFFYLLVGKRKFIYPPVEGLHVTQEGH